MPRSIVAGLALAFAVLAVSGTAAAAGEAAAKLTANSGAGSMGSSSTNTTGSFQLENNASGGQRIVSFKIDLSTAVLMDIVFDPAGTAGDPDGKAFELDTYDGTGTPLHSFENPHDGIGSEDGYDVLRVDFGTGVDFGPGDRMTFSADVDPTNVKGAPGPGPEHSASISGLELIGATVTVTFDDNTVMSVRMGGLAGNSNTNKMSVGVMSPDNLATPVISVPGKLSPFTSTTQPTVRIDGPAGANVRLWTFYSALYLDGVPGGGYDIDPYETNKIIGYGFSTVTIGGGGSVDVPLDLDYDPSTGGINQVAAVVEGSGGLRSSSSNILTIDYDPGGVSSDDEPPSIPGNLSASAVSASSLTLGWDASTDNTAIDRYTIFRDGGEIASTTQLSFTDGGRLPATSYIYEVVAVDIAGNQSGPATLSVSTPPDQDDPTPPGSLQAIGGDGWVQLFWSAASDDSGVEGYRVYRDAVLVSTVSGLGFLDSGLVNGTSYEYSVVAVDLAGKESPPATVSATPEAGAAVGNGVLRVNAGGEFPYVDPEGNTWEADYGFNTGSRSTYTTTILGTDNPELYQSRRSVSSSNPDLHYGFELPDGNYQVILHFVEVWTGGFTAGARVFDVSAEGTLMVDDLDIFDRAGGNTACTVTFPVVVSDGHLDLDFTRVANNPTISGIEVFEIPENVGGPPTFEEWLTLHGLDGETAGDSDGGGLDNLAEFQLQLDPTDAADDLEFRLVGHRDAGAMVLSFPPLKPIGDYFLHRSPDLEDIGNPANRIDTVTRSQIEAMTPQEREDYSVTDPAGPGNAFYQLFFEPVAE
ncbi:malectin domain-containing carbohydrate-binding protein [Luteolibacter marinus]|uniref:malectin domain-containing carbohydrate-binding protein n=1 Tax=Luteolibacter marinus TaxID=2776705 RepID=UPI001868E06C